MFNQTGKGSVFWEFLHNLIAHPLMAITGNSKPALRFHDFTADRAFGQQAAPVSGEPVPVFWYDPATSVERRVLMGDAEQLVITGANVRWGNYTTPMFATSEAQAAPAVPPAPSVPDGACGAKYSPPHRAVTVSFRTAAQAAAFQDVFFKEWIDNAKPLAALAARAGVKKIELKKPK